MTIKDLLLDQVIKRELYRTNRRIVNALEDEINQLNRRIILGARQEDIDKYLELVDDYNTLKRSTWDSLLLIDISTLSKGTQNIINAGY